MKYTKKLHAYRLKLLLKRKDISLYCPANSLAPDKNDGTFTGMPWGMGDDNYSVCDICHDFICLKRKTLNEFGCPCHVLGEKKARELAEKALAKYYDRPSTRKSLDKKGEV